MRLRFGARKKRCRVGATLVARRRGSIGDRQQGLRERAALGTGSRASVADRSPNQGAAPRSRRFRGRPGAAVDSTRSGVRLRRRRTPRGRQAPPHAPARTARAPCRSPTTAVSIPSSAPPSPLNRHDLEADQRAPLTAELDADQVDGFAGGAVLVRVTAALDLLECASLGC